MRDLTQNIMDLTGSGRPAYIFTIIPENNEWARLCWATEDLTLTMSANSDGQFPLDSEWLTSSAGSFVTDGVLKGDTLKIGANEFTIETVLSETYLEIDNFHDAGINLDYEVFRKTDGSRLIHNKLGTVEQYADINEGGGVAIVNTLQFSVDNIDNYINALPEYLQNRAVDIRIVGVTGSIDNYDWHDDLLQYYSFVIDEYSFDEKLLNFQKMVEQL